MTPEQIAKHLDEDGNAILENWTFFAGTGTSSAGRRAYDDEGDGLDDSLYMSPNPTPTPPADPNVLTKWPQGWSRDRWEAYRRGIDRGMSHEESERSSRHADETAEIAALYGVRR